MEHLTFALFLFATSAIFASLEIQIEGANGWASGLPTWRVHNGWTRLLLGSRPLTGYHFYTHLFITALLHAPFALALTPFSWAAELRILQDAARRFFEQEFKPHNDRWIAQGKVDREALPEPAWRDMWVGSDDATMA